MAVAVVQVLQACLAGRQQPMRLMQAGMAFAVWTFQHASAEAIQPHAPAMLEKLLGLLDRAPHCCIWCLSCKGQLCLVGGPSPAPTWNSVFPSPERQIRARQLARPDLAPQALGKPQTGDHQLLEKLLGLLDRELRCLQPSCLLESASTLLSAKLWGYCLCVVVWARA